MTKPNYHFFLGGTDLEMNEIAKMLEANGQPFDDAKMQWGAAASGYGRRLSDVEAEGKIPVLIELDPDVPLPQTAIEIDHHGKRSSEPASISQVADLIGVEMTRDQRLIAANDRGYINGMKREGATPEEIADIRARDRAAQGITAEHEAQAEDAMAREGEFDSPHGLKVLRCEHSKVATIMDRYRAQEDGGPKGILVLSDDGEVNYSGPGHIAKQLAEYFPDKSWSGGEGLGDPEGEAFFGMNAGKAAVAVHAAAVALTRIDSRELTDKNMHRAHADFLGYHPWVDRENPVRTTPFEGGFYAVQLSHEADSPIPARIWRENGGSFTDFGRLPNNPGLEKQACEGLDPMNLDHGKIYDERIQRSLVVPMDLAKQLGVSKEIQMEIRQAVLEEKARGRLIAGGIEDLSAGNESQGKASKRSAGRQM